MTVQALLDTNILLYAAMSRPSEQSKKQKALDIIASTEFGVSAQILAEFYTNVTKKGLTPLTALEALAWIEELELQPCVAIDAELVKRGIEISQRFKTSYWDGAVIAAAESLGAETLYSEDLNHGQFYGGVRVINPFTRL